MSGLRVSIPFRHDVGLVSLRLTKLSLRGHGGKYILLGACRTPRPHPGDGKPGVEWVALRSPHDRGFPRNEQAC